MIEAKPHLASINHEIFENAFIRAVKHEDLYSIIDCCTSARLGPHCREES
jgi:hypothetical protein